ncbi:MAG TPA: SEL1-like repeat protein [Xanthobacteraceae bacterium]|nr:SEL1-like repeat protein [Xanthobacteraceae bacterium]
MRRVKAILTAALFLIASPLAHSQPDPLRIFDGLWSSINSPGLQVIFNRVSADQREASLSFGHASISLSNGRDNSNLKVSGEGFDCYYYVAEDVTRVRMTWDLKSGPGVCPPLTVFERAAPPPENNDVAVAECDRLAASPFDHLRPPGIPGVLIDRIDASRAVPACQAAAAARPDDGRLILQLGRALYRVGGIAEREAARLYKVAADQGHAVAQNNLGVLYANGRSGLPNDDREAARLSKLAADQGFAIAQYGLGTFYATGRGGLPKDDQEAARLYRLAADQGYAVAQYTLGVFHANGRGGLSKDDTETARLYKLAANQGNALAQVNLGVFYANGRGGLTKDDTEAARLYRLAADQGNALAQVNLGVFHANGRGGIPKDDREAARLYKLAADQGNAFAQANLGLFHANSRGGLPKDDHEAARLYKLAADQGNAFAQANLGVFHANSRGGLPKDDHAAARLYKLAADQGNAFAQGNLGIFYANGRGGLPKDDREAARLYKLAADQGNVFAQSNLAIIYEIGLGGVSKDAGEGARLNNLAASQDNAPAQQLPAPKFETEPFSGSELLNGKRIAEQECANLAGAVWVVVDRKGECIRYYHTSAGSGADVLIFLTIDMVSVNGRGEAKPHEIYLRQTPANLKNGSASWSRALALPYVHLARPGTEGSSGEHNQRRTPREIELISAAIDAIKLRHNYARIHIAAYDAGAHAAAVLLAKRSDLGCVVLASGMVSLRSLLAEQGRAIDFTGHKTAIDPITLVDRIAKRPDLRIFVVTDPDDLVISARSQTIYAKRLAAAGLPVRQIFTAASGYSAHGLFEPARQIAANCAKGMADDAIVASIQKKLPETPPDADDPPLHGTDVISRGVKLNEAQCKKLGMALWVHAEGRDFCVRYWLSTVGGSKDEAEIYFHGDLGDPKKPLGALSAPAARMTSGGLQREAHGWSRSFGGPYAEVGRLGALGSSGVHLHERRTLLEVRVAMAALDGLKERHRFKRFHLVGQSGGGHTVAALTQLRNDIGCAVMASGAVSVKSVHRDRGLQAGPLIKSLYDPIDHVAKMQDQAGRRMVVLADPDDRIVSARSQREFVDRVRSRGLPILHITAAAGDEDHHGLASIGRRLVADCAKGVDDEVLIKRYQDKVAPALTPSSPPAPARRQS